MSLLSERLGFLEGHPLTSNVLIGFVTFSDPESSRGPGQCVTAAIALLPKAVHLLYTDSTRENAMQTEKFLRSIFEQVGLRTELHKLNVRDARDYQQLASELPKILRRIRRSERGSFHLVSGHPQVRLAMALCLNSYVLDGNLHEVRDPTPSQPWPETREGYLARLSTVDLEIFRLFRRIGDHFREEVRLTINLEEAQASLDRKPLPFRARGGHPRAFELLALTVLKALYGQDDLVPNALLCKDKGPYADLGSNAAVAVWRAIAAINSLANRLTRDSQNPLPELICRVRPGVYRLTPHLQPVEDTVWVEGDVLRFLRKFMHNPRKHGFVRF